MPEMCHSFIGLLVAASATAVLACASVSGFSADEGLVAEYRFDRVVDDQTDDSSGNGNSAGVFGPRVIQTAGGHALLFDGVDDYADCGDWSLLDLRQAASIECWVRPDSIPADEVGVAGKGTEAYGLTFYKDGCCYWYISSGANHLKQGLGIGAWHYVVGTYDGHTARLYVDGRLVGERSFDVPIATGGHFLIGAREANHGFFHGAIAGVRVYSRALSADVITSRFAAAAPAMLVRAEPVTDGRTLKGDGYAIRVGEQGGLQVEMGPERYNIETHFSCPGETIGWNDLGAPGGSCDPTWRPRLSAGPDGSMRVVAAGTYYSVAREVTLAGHRVVVTDAITNTGSDDVGIIYRHDLITPGPVQQRLIGGADRAGAHLLAENPSVYVKQSRSSLAWLAEEDVLRLQLSASSTLNSARMSADRFALQPGKSHTFRWVLYPFGPNADYWTFINEVRRDWNVNFRLIGPWTLLDVTRQIDLIRDPEALRHHLSRNRAQVVAFMPWVDYDNYSAMVKRPINRTELKPLLKEAMAAVKAVNPDIMCIGCMECNLVSLPEDAARALYATVEGAPQNQYQFTPEQMQLLTRYNLRWQDCLLADRNGHYRYELYYRGDHYPMLAIAVYAAPGNDQHKYWLDQAHYLLEEVGLDGVYIDQFNLAFSDEQRYSFDMWDGTTVDIDPATGRIKARYTDGALVSITPQRSLIDYVLSKGRYMVANTYPASMETQSVHCHRFNEGEWAFDVFSWPDGSEPPLEPYGTAGHLSTPISLGFRPDRYGKKGEDSYAHVIMKGVIAYLRTGLLYYHYSTDIPESGPGAGEYGAINHMFPITPVEVHEGCIVGKERTVTCVSGDYRWGNDRRPTILVFDLLGHAVTPRATITRRDDGWHVHLMLRDWAEIAVIE
jgi:hypothetical protein